MESWGGALILLDSAGAALTFKTLLGKLTSHDSGVDVQLGHLTTDWCCFAHSEGSVLTERQPRAQWQPDIRWLSCGRIVSREVTRVMTSLFLKTLSFICPPSFVFWRAGGSLSTLYCTRHGGVSALGLSHTQNQQTTSEEPPQPLKEQFCDPYILVFDILQFQRERNSSAAVSCCQVRYDKFVHFICDLPGPLELLRFIVIVKWPVSTVQLFNTQKTAANWPDASAD